MYAEIRTEAEGSGKAIVTDATNTRAFQSRLEALNTLALEGWTLLTSITCRTITLDTLVHQDEVFTPGSDEEIEELKTVLASTQPKFGSD